MRVLLAACLLILAACGSGDGVAEQTGRAVAEVVILDLQDGTVATRRSLPPGMDSDPAYRDRLLVLVGLPAGSSNGGSPVGSRWALSDEAPRQIGSGRLFMSVYEVTRAQWLRLGGAATWEAADLAALGGTGSLLPAHGVSQSAAQDILAASGRRFEVTLRLPSESEWEYACRAGGAGMFAWGDAMDFATVTQHAVTAETRGVGAGPLVAGQRRGNTWGLQDMHGNLWELTADGQVRGGSWLDALPMARSANRLALDPETAHPLVGVRPVMEW
jgi:formylglycine-generating enzyme required for sulfatase activity